MRKQFLWVCAAAGLLSIGGFAFGAEKIGGTLHRVAQYDLNQPSPPAVQAASPGANYSNLDNFLSAGFQNGGASGGITTLVADDIIPTTGGVCSEFAFTVANFATPNISARARVRLYQDNGGTPGAAIAGITFNPISFPSGVGIYDTGPLPASFQFPLPNGQFWAGITFDNVDDTSIDGTTGATDADLNQLGQGIFSPPVLGSSADLAFQTNTAGSFFVNNPAGSTFNFSGNPPANFGWEFIVPEPASLGLAGLGLLTLVARRRH